MISSSAGALNIQQVNKALSSLFVWLWLIVNDRNFQSEQYFSLTQTSQQYFFTNQQRYELANRTGYINALISSVTNNEK